MKQDNLSALSDEKLLKRRDLLKGIAISLGIVAIIVMALFIYLFLTKEWKEIPTATFVAIAGLAASTIPLSIVLGQVNKEVKSRNLK